VIENCFEIYLYAALVLKNRLLSHAIWRGFRHDFHFALLRKKFLDE